MKATIRKAKHKDLTDIYGLVKELAIFEKEHNQPVCSVDLYKKLYDEGLFDALVVIFNERIIGTAIYYPTFSTWKGKMLYLEDFYVQPKYRNRGIGQALFDAVIIEAKKSECQLMKWQVLDWNKDAIRFYQRNGAKVESEWLNGKLEFI